MVWKFWTDSIGFIKKILENSGIINTTRRDNLKSRRTRLLLLTIRVLFGYRCLRDGVFGKTRVHRPPVVGDIWKYALSLACSMRPHVFLTVLTKVFSRIIDFISVSGTLISPTALAVGSRLEVSWRVQRLTLVTPNRWKSRNKRSVVLKARRRSPNKSRFWSKSIALVFQQSQHGFLCFVFMLMSIWWFWVVLYSCLSMCFKKVSFE